MENVHPSAKPSGANGSSSCPNGLDNLTDRFEQLVKRKKPPLHIVEPLAAIPSWPATMRGTPNACFRSALFAGIQGNERIAYKI